MRAPAGALFLPNWAKAVLTGPPCEALKAEVDPVKVRPSVKPICENCKVIRRHGQVIVICTNPRHKQRQG